MKIIFDLSAIAQTRWYQYLARFLLGGLVTAAAGLIAKKWGPGIGGLFLAFPAILPATATLIEKHEKERKQRHGLAGARRARQAAGADAAGAAMGSFGLFTFALVVWKAMPRISPVLAIAAAVLAYAGVALAVWWTRRRA